ncbi:hypothetical protein HBA92_08865 [Ochrobactrum sp. MR28]|nr:hypothetical protein [Ochrobactrum sp. MR28]MBX8815032.1 hypothetical protein [Ochrobactrum sp. MR31]
MTDSSVTGRNQNHSDVRDESARDNDPLFELSRIFGFDEPAEQKNIYTPQAEPELSAEMSLERELMADFDADFAADFAAEPEQATGNYRPEPAANNYQTEPTANNYQSEPVVSNYQPSQPDYRPAAPAVAESRPYQHNVEPHFSGYAPLQRAYAPQTPVADDYAVQQPAVEPEATQYYAEPDYAPAAPEAAQDSYYAAYSDLPQAPAFSEPAQEDYFSSFEDELSQTLAPELTPQPVADTSAFDFSDIGREPQQEYVVPSYSDAFAQSKAFSEAAQQAPASFEDELSFLLQDPAPAAAPVQPAAPRYEESAYAPARTAYQPAAYNEPVAPETDFAPLFDAPAPEVAPITTDYDPYKSATQESYVNERPAALEQIDDEFFDAPDLNSLRNRAAAPQTNWEAEQAEDTAVKSFADLFGAGSQSSDFAEPEAEANYQPEQVAAYEEPQSESFDFADDFFNAELTNTVAEEPTYEPEPVAPLAHNAVRGYSSYTFGAATPAAAGAETFVNPTVERAAPAPYAAPAPIAAAQSYEQPAATDDFFSNDDFDFSFDEEIQPENDFSISNEDDLKFDLPEEPEIPAYEPVQSSVRKAFTPAPEIETVVVSENKVEQTQALDLPDVSYGDEAKETGLNSLESEFAEIFSTISVNEAAAPDTTSEADKAFENILQDNFAEFHAAKKAEPQEADLGYGALAGAAAGLAGAAAAGAAMRGSAPQARADAAGNATQDDYYNHWAAQGAQSGTLAGSQPNDFDTYNLGENFARDEDEYTEVRPHEKTQQRKPLFWAGVAAAALIVVGGGYFMLKSGGVVGGEPEVLRADTQPVKVQPENPGGTVVPNQDKAVYDQVSGTKPAAPEQKTLINTEEEPVDVGLLAGQDVEEDRLMNEDAGSGGNALPAANNTQPAERELITPRTVKTMVVRADGTLVPGEAPAAPSEPAATDNGLDEASRLISQSAVPERLGSDKPATSAQSAAAPRVVQTQTFTASGEQAKPTAAPVVPSRPAEQPVNVVGNVERPAQNQALQQVANANVTTSNAPAGTWFIQVASQPSAELAQKNYANLTSRYGNIIGGKGVDIKKADIPGKGTYYRVRIPGGSKAEAAALCDRLKSAGGSCFPTL